MSGSCVGRRAACVHILANFACFLSVTLYICVCVNVFVCMHGGCGRVYSRERFNMRVSIHLCVLASVRLHCSLLQSSQHGRSRSS